MVVKYRSKSEHPLVLTNARMRLDSSVWMSCRQDEESKESHCGHQVGYAVLEIISSLDL